MQTISKVKVVILTGFLGSGKTTFIETILKTPHLTTKVAVIQNEFSDAMGIEAPLMTDGDGKIIDDFYEMPNGCICCTVKDDLVATLDTLLEKNQSIQLILIETNGLADPGAVVQTFWLDDQLDSYLTLHKTIGIVDCSAFQSNLAKDDLHPLLVKQIAFADTLLLNKIDKCSSAVVEQVRKYCAGINPEIIMLQSQFAQIPLSEIEKPTSVSLDFSKFQDKHIHMDKKYESKILKIQNELNPTEVQAKIGKLLWQGPEGLQILRMKGVFRSKENSQLQMIQSVGDTFEIREVKEILGQDSKILVIGSQISSHLELIEGIFK